MSEATWAMCWLIAAAPVLGAAELNCPPEQHDSLMAIGEGYLDNRESFPYFRCEFTLTEGKSESLEDGIAGRLQDPIVSSGRWVVDGGKYRYELTCDPKLLEQAFKEGPRHPLSFKDPTAGGGKPLTMVALPCETLGFVTNGLVQLRFDHSISSANIRTADVPLPGITITPFSVGIMGENDELNPGTLLTQGGTDAYAFAWLMPHHDETGNELTVAFGWGPDEQSGLRRSMRLDPDRGFLPVSCDTYMKADDSRIATYGLRVSHLAFTEIRPVSDGRWFPGRAVMVEYPDGQALHRTQIIEVTRIDADRRPEADDLAMVLPRGTAVANPTDLRSSFKLDADRAVGPDDLQALLDETATTLTRRVVGQPLSREPQSRYLTVVSLNVIVVAVIVFVLLMRRRRPSLRVESSFQEPLP